jgi:hypothetical protein
MRCDDVAELTIDYLDGALGEEARRKVDEHLSGCAACRAELDNLGSVWSALGRLPAEVPSPDLGARFRRVLGEHGTPRAVGGGTWYRLPLLQAVAALVVLCAGIAAGIAIQRAVSATQVAREGDDGRHQFVLLLYDTEEMRRLSKADESKLVEEYTAWARRLAEAGDLAGGEKLASEYRMIAAASAGVLAAPGAMGGFFVVKARSYEEAAAIAQTCPHLAHGGAIEVRMIEPT